MTTFLSIALLIVGTVATLAAFGGKTWNDGTEPIIERISLRGWISLSCLLLALCLGIFKEIRVQKQDADKRVSDAVREAAAESRQENLLSQLAVSKQAELDAKRSLDDLRSYAASTDNHLRETQHSLDDVRGNLIQTRAQLRQQSASNLITAFSNTNLSIRDVLLYIPNTPEAGIAHSVRELLVTKPDQSDCFNNVSLQVNVNLPFHGESVNYDAKDNETEHEFTRGRIPKVDRIDSTTSFWNWFVFEEYRDLRKLEKRFKHGIIYDPQAYSLHLKVPPGMFGAGDAASYYKEFYEPADLWATSYKPKQRNACYSKFETYYKESVDRAILVIVFDDTKRESLIFHLKAVTNPNQQRETNDDDVTYLVRFAIDGPPELLTNWLHYDIDNDWPKGVVAK